MRVHVVFLPTSRDKLQSALLEGRGDIVAGNVKQTTERQGLADFIAPTFGDVKELVVTGPGAPTVATVDDLAGQTVHVRQQSGYRESLDALNTALEQRGKVPVEIKFLGSTTWNSSPRGASVERPCSTSATSTSTTSRISSHTPRARRNATAAIANLACAAGVF
jgi:hypothetical protein